LIAYLKQPLPGYAKACLGVVIGDEKQQATMPDPYLREQQN